jgi:hypothetical protein
MAAVWLTISGASRPKRHQAYLFRIRLEFVCLIFKYVTDFHWECAIFLSFDKRKIPEFQVNVILSLEVVVDRCFHWWCIRSLPVFQHEFDILGMTTFWAILLIEAKVLDGIGL